MTFDDRQTEPIGAASPHDLPHVFAAAFNSADPGAIDLVYEDAGLLVRAPGDVVAGAERRSANGALAGLGVPIAVSPRHVYVNGGLALLVVDWALVGDAADGARVDIRATATDVARRGPDGLWRYAIDNPFGVAPTLR